jgi:hypothetical protein
MLLRGDLEAMVGDKATARICYQRLIDLWSGADPDLQPMVTRARKALDGLK